MADQLTFEEVAKIVFETEQEKGLHAGMTFEQWFKAKQSEDVKQEKEVKQGATSEKLKKLIASVEKAEAKVEKIGKTIERHFKQLDKKIAVLTKVGYEIDYSNVQFEGKKSWELKEDIKHIENLKWDQDGKGVPNYWELCEVCWKLEDIRGSYQKLAEAKQILENWNNKLAKEQEKENFVANNNVPQVIIDFVNEWGELAVEWFMRNDKAPDEKRIRAFVENEKRVKIMVLTMRVQEVVGNITDAKGLSISEQGTLNGFVYGDQGKARVETITAGGWNIQCWHFRTIVVKL